MSTDDKDLLAAEYVLGTLDDGDRAQVRDALPGDPALAEAVRAWESRLTSLEGESAPLAPPAHLWSRIEARIDSEQARDSQSTTVRADEGEWTPLAPGVEKKSLFIDRVQGVETYLLRMAPGGCIPAHAHSEHEECLVLEGGIETADERYFSGDYIAMPAGTMHPELVSPNGGLFFLRGEIRHAS